MSSPLVIRDDKGRPLASLRKWKFSVDTEDGFGYLLTDGKFVRDPDLAEDWISTDNEADREADRRSNLFEDLTGETANRVVYTSQGKVKEGEQP